LQHRQVPRDASRDSLKSLRLNAAADQVGVHRNTIAYWRHTSPAFEAALRDAQNERADMLREEAVARAPLAFQAPVPQ
jgi:DNA-binding PucR family transcriptional regulator